MAAPTGLLLLLPTQVSVAGVDALATHHVSLASPSPSSSVSAAAATAAPPLFACSSSRAGQRTHRGRRQQQQQQRRFPQPLLLELPQHTQDESARVDDVITKDNGGEPRTARTTTAVAAPVVAPRTIGKRVRIDERHNACCHESPWERGNETEDLADSETWLKPQDYEAIKNDNVRTLLEIRRRAELLVEYQSQQESLIHLHVDSTLDSRFVEDDGVCCRGLETVVAKLLARQNLPQLSQFSRQAGGGESAGDLGDRGPNHQRRVTRLVVQRHRSLRQALEQREAGDVVVDEELRALCEALSLTDRIRAEERGRLDAGSSILATTTRSCWVDGKA